ncbi:MAG: hypothetical protein AVDCRST_MAG05-1716, partial [uncultured Rubrobacteraceae bacterium]
GHYLPSARHRWVHGRHSGLLFRRLPDAGLYLGPPRGRRL